MTRTDPTKPAFDELHDCLLGGIYLGDLNNLTTPGIYRVSSTAANSPAAVVLVVIVGNSGEYEGASGVTQTAVRTNGESWTRGKFGTNSWSAWKKTQQLINSTWVDNGTITQGQWKQAIIDISGFGYTSEPSAWFQPYQSGVIVWIDGISATSVTLAFVGVVSWETNAIGWLKTTPY